MIQPPPSETEQRLRAVCRRTEAARFTYYDDTDCRGPARGDERAGQLHGRPTDRKRGNALARPPGTRHRTGTARGRQPVPKGAAPPPPTQTSARAGRPATGPRSRVHRQRRFLAQSTPPLARRGGAPSQPRGAGTRESRRASGGERGGPAPSCRADQEVGEILCSARDPRPSISCGGILAVVRLLLLGLQGRCSPPPGLVARLPISAAL